MGAGVALIVVGPTARTLSTSSRWSVSSHLDVQSIILNDAALTLLFPLIVALLTCLPLFARLAHRWVANTRARMSVRKFLGLRLIRIAAVAATSGFLVAVVPFLAAFVLWPALGNPGIHPEDSYSTPEAALLDSFTDTSYSQLLAVSPAFYGVSYALWVGFAAATLGMLTWVCLALIPNRFLALTAPCLLWIIQWLWASFAGLPQTSIVYAVFPQGMGQLPIVEAASPMFVLAIATAVVATIVFVRAPRLRAFA